MGRRKIAIQAISDSKIRHNTFNKRKNGLVKKAAELSMLCNVKMLLAFEDLHGNLIQYSTHGIFDPKQYFSGNKALTAYEFTSKHYPNFFKGSQSEKKNSNTTTVTTETLEESQPQTYVPMKSTKLLESLDSNIKTCSKMVEKLNASMDNIKIDRMARFKSKELNVTEKSDPLLRKIRKVDGPSHKLEYQSDNEHGICESRDFSPKIECLPEETQYQANTRSQEEMAIENQRSKSPVSQDLIKGLASAGGMPSPNPLQAMSLNYALNFLQNPLSSMLLQSTNNDLLAFSKSLLLFSSLTNSINSMNSMDKLASVFKENQRNAQAISSEPSVESSLSAQSRQATLQTQTRDHDSE